MVLILRKWILLQIEVCIVSCTACLSYVLVRADALLSKGVKPIKIKVMVTDFTHKDLARQLTWRGISV